LLWLLSWLKNYWTEPVAAAFWRCDEKTHRKYVHKLLDFLYNNFSTVWKKNKLSIKVYFKLTIFKWDLFRESMLERSFYFSIRQYRLSNTKTFHLPIRILLRTTKTTYNKVWSWCSSRIRSHCLGIWKCWRASLWHRFDKKLWAFGTFGTRRSYLGWSWLH
jgi:hypothetical protein